MKKLVNLTGRLVDIDNKYVQHFLKLGFVEHIKKSARKTRAKKLKGKDE